MPERQVARRVESAEPRLGAPCDACGVRAVSAVSVCSALEVPELERLRSIMTTVHLEPGQTAIHEGDPADSLFNVVSGTVKLFKLLADGRRQITGFLVPGDFLGIVLNERYAYSAEAVDRVHLCRFPRRRFETLLGEMPRLERRLLGAASNELVAAQDQMLLLGRKTAQEKVASFLRMLARRTARQRSPVTSIGIAMSRNDIADYLGLTTETVSRSLTRLKEAGVIASTRRGRIELLDEEALRALAEGG